MRAAGHRTRLVQGRRSAANLETLRGAAIVFLAVPDGAVREVATHLRKVQESVAFVHLSGALGLDALEPLRTHHEIGSFHPLQSFPAPRSPVAFRGTTVAVDASTAGLKRRLRALARSMGSRPRDVGDSERALYHVAAVFASNYLDVVVAEAVALLQAIGWTRSESTEALMPLIGGSIDNIRRKGAVAALTGPIRRGDVATVHRHLAALRELDVAPRSRRRPPVEALYRMLGTLALDVAEKAGLDPAAARRMHRALTDKTAATRRRAG